MSSKSTTMPLARKSGIVRHLRVATVVLARLVASFERWLCARPRYVAAVAALAVLQGTLIATHVPWLDEAQGLLVAVQPASLGEMMEQLRYEGHPPLWYLLLRGLNWLLPYDAVLRAASIVIAGAIWWSVLSTTRFSRAEKLLLLASELVLIEYCAISRSLGFGVAMIFVAARLWRSRWFWLAIAVLPQADFFFGVISIMLIAFRLRAANWRLDVWSAAGLALWLLSSLLAAYAVLPAPDAITDPPRELLEQLLAFLSQLGTAAVPIQADLGGLHWNATLLPGIFLWPATIWIFLKLAGSDRLHRAATMGFLLFVLVFALFVYPLYFRHISLIAVWVIAAYWIDGASLAGRRRVWRAWLACMAFAGALSGAATLARPFDTGAEFADRIRASGLENATLVSFPDWHSIAVASALARPIGGLERGCTSSFIRWNHRQMKPIRYARVKPKLDAMTESLGTFYLITPAELTFPRSVARPVITVPAGHDGISYALWKVGGGAAMGRQLAPCVEGLPPLSRVR